jgi:hypothetical protein
MLEYRKQGKNMEGILGFVVPIIILKLASVNSVLLIPAAQECFVPGVKIRTREKKKDAYVKPVNCLKNSGLKGIISA